MTNNIKARRLALNMTQPQLSAILREIDPRIDVGMVSRFEQNVCYPTEPVLKGLETALQATRSELYGELASVVVPAADERVSAVTRRLAELIPIGKEHAVKRETLATLLGVDDRAMRDAVSRARREGLVILNDQTGRGYYRSDDAGDLRRQLERTHHRALSLLAQEKHIRRRLEAQEGVTA